MFQILWNRMANVGVGQYWMVSVSLCQFLLLKMVNEWYLPLSSLGVLQCLFNYKEQKSPPSLEMNKSKLDWQAFKKSICFYRHHDVKYASFVLTCVYALTRVRNHSDTCWCFAKNCSLCLYQPSWGLLLTNFIYTCALSNICCSSAILMQELLPLMMCAIERHPDSNIEILWPTHCLIWLSVLMNNRDE